MPDTTNSLRGKGKYVALPLGASAALVCGIALFTSHPVRAALSPTAPIEESSVSSLTQLDQAVEAVASRVNPAVVNIAVTARAPEQAEGQEQADGSEGASDPMQQFFQNFGQGQGQGEEQQQPRHQQGQLEHGIGSGFIVSPDGYIVTNNHVVNGATEIRVTLHDRRTFPAKVIGTDKLTDLAVIKINGSDLPSLPWGESKKLQQGETVLAFGSPFGYFQFSVTRGIVSALNRPNPDRNDARKPGGYIQTDAAINPGNSGGPLVDAYGEVVGINTFLISDSGSFAGAGFAIPSQIARPIVATLIKYGKVDHGYLGIGINDVTPDNQKFFDMANSSGAVVTQVAPDSPAGRAGVHVGDVITSLNGQAVDTASDLQMAVSDAAPGNSVTLGIEREGKSMKLETKLGDLNGTAKVTEASEENPGHGVKLGVAIADITPALRQQLNLPDDVRGVAIEDVRPGSPAEDAGLAQGDVIQQFNRQPVQSAEQFQSDVQKVPAGQDVMVLVWSNGGASYRVIHTAALSNGM
jgi:serine protease Do